MITDATDRPPTDCFNATAVGPAPQIQPFSVADFDEKKILGTTLPMPDWLPEPREISSREVLGKIVHEMTFVS